MLTIGALSRASGVKVATIRYYEGIGLIAEPGRTAGNQRRYGDTDVRRLQFIRHARDLGFAIGDIAELIELEGTPERPCGRADEIAARQLQAVRIRITQLHQLEVELARISKACDGGVAGDCSVLHALGDHTLCAGDHSAAVVSASASASITR